MKEPEDAGKYQVHNDSTTQGQIIGDNPIVHQHFYASQDKATASPPKLQQAQQDRMHMLRRLHLRYEQMLTQSLQGAVQVELGLTEKPAAVHHAASLSLRFPEQPERLLPAHTSIQEAYELAQQELLILGEPGAGKSTLLLELAHYLVELAERESTQQLPIVLPLSSWAINRRPLQEWLAEQVTLLYDVPGKLSHHWIQVEQLLPLLDGLDEMESSARAACINAINIYHHKHLRPLVVCSRTDEYDTAARHERLALHTAVVVQSLSREQVESYLTNLGESFDALRTALKENLLLQALATTPLLLQVLMLTYHGTLARELPQREVQLRQQIWTDYVQRMVQSKGNVRRYPLPVTCARLRFLAQQMYQHNLTVFSLEQLQPDWLPTRRRFLYQWSGGLVFGLVNGLVFGLASGLIFVLASGLKGWLVPELVNGSGYGLIFGLVSGLKGWLGTKILYREGDYQFVETLTWSWKEARSALVSRRRDWLIFGLAFGLVFGLGNWLVFWLVFGLVFLGGGLLSGFSRKRLTEHLLLSPNEGIRRSVKNGLVFGLIFGLVFWLVGGLGSELGNGLVLTLIGGLVFVLGGGLLGGLLGGLSAALQHSILRFWLWCTCPFPLNVHRFLDDATARILLRRVGGGYSFTHRLLLDYFAGKKEGTFHERPRNHCNRRCTLSRDHRWSHRHSQDSSY